MRAIFKKKRPIYKQGKLSQTRKRRASVKDKKTLFIVIACVLLTFVFAIILGNILGAKAEKSKAKALSGEKVQGLVLEPTGKGELPSIKAYSVDLTGITVNDHLTLKTGSARERGNAIFMLVQNSSGDIVYNSPMTEELGLPSCNMGIERIDGHFGATPADYVCAYWKSDFSPDLGPSSRLKTQYNEARFLSELSENSISEILVSFDSEINEESVLAYQTYLLNLKTAMPSTPIGVTFDISLFESENATTVISKIMSACDFCSVKLAGSYQTNGELEEMLAKCSYISAKYPCRMMLSYKNEEFFADTLKLLGKLKIESFVVIDFTE